MQLASQPARLSMAALVNADGRFEDTPKKAARPWEALVRFTRALMAMVAVDGAAFAATQASDLQHGARSPLPFIYAQTRPHDRLAAHGTETTATSSTHPWAPSQVTGTCACMACNTAKITRQGPACCLHLCQSASLDCQAPVLVSLAGQAPPMHVCCVPCLQRHKKGPRAAWARTSRSRTR